MGYVYTLWYNSFEPDQNLNDLPTLFQNRDHHREDFLALSFDEKGNARLEIVFHGRPEEALYTAALQADDLVREDWDDKSYDWPAVVVTLASMQAKVKQFFPSEDAQSWLIFRDDQKDVMVTEPEPPKDPNV